MPAYIVAHLEVTDPGGFEEYRQRVPALIEKFNGRYIIRGGAIENVENDIGVQRLTIVEYPDMETAKAFYYSPEYEELKAIRIASTNSSLALVEGFEA